VETSQYVQIAREKKKKNTKGETMAFVGRRTPMQGQLNNSQNSSFGTTTNSRSRSGFNTSTSQDSSSNTTGGSINYLDEKGRYLKILLTLIPPS
jgi:retron-type reverse transcriptase